MGEDTPVTHSQCSAQGWSGNRSASYMRALLAWSRCTSGLQSALALLASTAYLRGGELCVLVIAPHVVVVVVVVICGVGGERGRQCV